MVVRGDSFLELAIAAYKDKVLQETYEKLRSEAIALALSDADARRTKASILVRSMAKLKMQLAKFVATYQPIAREAGQIPAIEEYIKDIELQIKQYSYQKNKGLS